MLSLWTGLPGNGKTLFLIDHLRERAAKEQRHVYVHGIALTDKGRQELGWTEFTEPEKWWEFPPGAIVVMDEAQFVFPRRNSGSKVPEHVNKMATHRHLGIDVYIVTQKPTMIDVFIRDLVEDHYHVKRLFGSRSARVSKFSGASMLARADFKDAIKSDRRFPRDVYPLYVSSQLHTHKLQLPWKKFAPIILGAVATIGAITYLAFNFWDDMAGSPAIPKGAAPSGIHSTSARPPGPLTREEWLEGRVARLEGLPHTAPVFDAVMAVQSAPKPVACVQMGPKCNCYSQQGTRIFEVPHLFCLQAVQNGWFDETVPDSRTGELPGQGRGHQVSAPPSSTPQGATSGQVLASLPPQLAPNLSVGSN
ncbi:hypothetical protein GCM10007907_16880 [Chitinimonas prasina]|uniref:Zona occludens toxin N-terminal domain-containing protein n=1 Tax=Chitinimonas prasina TaxID=1434937 RepID=A0ABQ5YEI5_9NEIS|nr:zonular occludens toxin domain-containing protein [Chitinimonas prasina]GLR12898.1 hypothetical protein GCM10007907_16880 [Chitinimonas prasina]